MIEDEKIVCNISMNKNLIELWVLFLLSKMMYMPEVEINVLSIIN